MLDERDYALQDAHWNTTALVGYQPIPADGNADGTVNNADLVTFFNHDGLTAEGSAVGDFNNDGVVNNADLGIMFNHYGTTGTGNWQLQERFSYSPYGVVSAFTPSFASRSDFLAWNVGFQGMLYDTTTKLNFTLSRIYEASTGRFLTVDPMHADGMDWYRGFADNPINGVDPTGEKRIIFVFDGLFENRQKSWEDPKQMVYDNMGTILAFKQAIYGIPDSESHYFTGTAEGIKAAVALAQAIFGKAHQCVKNPTASYYDTLFMVGWSNGGNAAIRAANTLNSGKNPINSLGFTTDVIPPVAGGTPLYWLNFYQTNAVQNGHPVAGQNVTNLNVTDAVVALKNSQNRGKSAHFWINRLDNVVNDLTNMIEQVPPSRSSPSDIEKFEPKALPYDG